MCSFCGCIGETAQGIFGDWLCCLCLQQEELESQTDQACDIDLDQQLWELFL